ncbi:MAG: GTPase ObgE [Erysipelotrichaceae bacterium]|nr:GTPase ObgE [Erysipelotrichaceae bacterium]
MEFIDKVKIKLKAGNGGDGIVAFRRVKYNPFGGPSGGDGGDGGSIIFKVDTNKSTLLDLRYNRLIKASDGMKGKNNNMSGESAGDIIIKVPLGTVIKDADSDELLADLAENNQEAIICKGGKGGKGNFHFATGRNSAPEFAKIGTIGEEKTVILELKLLADVGLVGFPSVGKSTLLSVVSKATPEIADYPFTTLKPHLGIVKVYDGRSFVMSDLPGLIKDASIGKGLGLEFLRHIERCRVILHVVDMAGEERDPLDDYEIINDELSKYRVNLLERPQIVIANKMDMPNAKDNLWRFKQKYPHIKIFETCTIIREGLDEVLFELANLLAITPAFPIYDKRKVDEVKVYRYEAQKDFEVFNEGNGVYRVVGDKIKKYFEQVDFENEISVLRFARTIRKMGVDDALRAKGCKDGDKVFIESYGFDFVDEE